MSSQHKFTGKIIQYNSERQFGFILASDGKTKIFFHLNVLQSPQIEPKKNEEVQVLAEKEPKGWKAVAVGSSNRRAQQKTPTPKPLPKNDVSPTLFRQPTTGKIVEWNDERGFGFIQPANSKEKIFFHVNDLPLNQGKFRPKQGETVVFTAKLDGKRWAATSVTSAERQRTERAQKRRQAERAAELNSRAMIAVVVGLVWLGFCAMKLPKLALVYGVLSLILFALYAKDKNAANHGEWRVPEANLHGLAIVGGWCGALLARYLFNHKTTKQEFVFTFWGTVVVNVGATLYFFA